MTQVRRFCVCATFLFGIGYATVASADFITNGDFSSLYPVMGLVVAGSLQRLMRQADEGVRAVTHPNPDA